GRRCWHGRQSHRSHFAPSRLAPSRPGRCPVRPTAPLFSTFWYSYPLPSPADFQSRTTNNCLFPRWRRCLPHEAGIPRVETVAACQRTGDLQATTPPLHPRRAGIVIVESGATGAASAGSADPQAGTALLLPLGIRSPCAGSSIRSPCRLLPPHGNASPGQRAAAAYGAGIERIAGATATLLWCRVVTVV